MCTNKRLRNIALTVEQAEGGYVWLLFEGAAGRLFKLEQARYPLRSYAKALQAGYEKLALLSASGLVERGIAYDELSPAPAEQPPSTFAELAEA